MLSQFLPALHCLPSTVLGQCSLNDLVNKQALEGPMFKPGEVSTDGPPQTISCSFQESETPHSESLSVQ